MKGVSITLQRTEENAAEIDALAQELGLVGIDGVVGDLDRRARWTGVPGKLVDRGFRWALGDRVNLRWWPQGITWSTDSGRPLLATSWYSRTLRGRNHGSRITLVDLDTLRYRHLLLVQPVAREGRATFEPLHIHAGGLVWVGPHLHVAATAQGMFTCRPADAMRVPDHLLASAYGHRFVLPVRFCYRAESTDGLEPLRYSFLSLERTADDTFLVTGEYGRGGQSTRLAHYRLDPETLHLATDDDGRSRPVLLEDAATPKMQGAASVTDRWYVTSSRGHLTLSSVYAGRPGDWTEHRRAAPMGVEDLTYWPATDVFWSLSEHPLARWVFAMPRSRIDFDKLNPRGSGGLQ